MAIHEFTKVDLTKIFDAVIGKTLGQVDVNNVFAKTIDKPKITGIAGDVIEQSVLNYPPDNKQEADLLVDGIDTELKTTGLKRTRKGKHILEAKEPMSITAVSPNQIVSEEFTNSNLWHKLENLLLVYYLYDSESTVSAAEYAKFTIQDYQFYNFSKEDREILMNDWLIVKNFIQQIKEQNLDIAVEYPKISKLRKQMLYMDTAPKYPHPPRFRLRRQVISTIVQEHLGVNFEPLDGSKQFSNYTELDRILQNFSSKYIGKSIKEIAVLEKLPLKYNKDGKVSKAITEQILTTAFGTKIGKLRKLDTFAKIGTLPKTLTLTVNGARTEDTKFDTIDFTEWLNPEIEFEDSMIYQFFSEQTMLFTVFEEAYKDSPLEKNIFIGFKRLNFDDEFLYNYVKPTWEKVRLLVWSNEFKVTPILNKEGKPVINKTGIPQDKTNFPKSSNSIIFLRGTSSDSTNKPLVINGYKLYNQQFWIKGSMLVNLLANIDYI